MHTTRFKTKKLCFNLTRLGYGLSAIDLSLWREDRLDTEPPTLLRVIPLVISSTDLRSTNVAFILLRRCCQFTIRRAPNFWFLQKPYLVTKTETN